MARGAGGGGGDAVHPAIPPGLPNALADTYHTLHAFVLTVGTAGDSLFYYKGRQWTTMEQGSWWKHPLILWEKYYDEQRKQVSLTLSSPYSNLNGKYGRHVNPSDAGIMWSRWKGRFYSLKRTQMKIRLAPFVQF